MFLCCYSAAAQIRKENIMDMNIKDDCPVYCVIDNKEQTVYVYTRKLDAIYKHVSFRARRIGKFKGLPDRRKFHADYREFDSKAKLISLPSHYKAVMS